MSRHTMPRGPLDSDGRAFNKGLRHDAVSAASRTPLFVAGKAKLRMSEVTGSAGRHSKEAAFALPWLHSATGRCHPKPPEVSSEAPLNIRRRSDGCLLLDQSICDWKLSVLPAPSGTPVVKCGVCSLFNLGYQDRLQIALRL